MKNLKIIIKKKKGSNGMEPSQLIPELNNLTNVDYINVSNIGSNSYAGMAEWLMQPIDTRHPSGSVGSIPTSSVTNIKFLNGKF